jgi:phosphomannomutase/phosphoglucomutase
MKRRTNEMGALAGFEKSGHFFFNKPTGRGYDDGLVSAIAICEMLDRAPDKSMADLKDALPKTWSSPTMSPHCADETKYGVADAVVKHLRRCRKTATRSRARRSAISSPSTACASPSRTAAGAWCGLIEQAGTGGGGREPGERAAHARHVRGDGFGAAHASRSRRV